MKNLLYKFKVYNKIFIKGIYNRKKYLLKQKGISSLSYMINYTDPNKLAKHTFTVCHDDEHYYLVEASWVNDNTVFDNLNDLIMSVVKRYPRMYKIENLDKLKESNYKIINTDYKDALNKDIKNIKEGKNLFLLIVLLL